MRIEYRFEVLYPYSVHANILNMKSYLTYRLKSKKITPEAYAVVDAYLLSAKNVRNSVVFLINNILTAYTYNKENKQFLLKEELHQNQKDMIAFMNKAITAFNLKRDEDKQYKEFDSVLSLNTQRQLLDKSLVEQALKLVEADKEEHLRAFANTHSFIAQMILQQVVDSYKYYYKALAQYYIKPDAFTGKPKAPNYSERNARSTFEIDQSRLTKKGYLIKVLSKWKLFRKFPDKNPLLEDEIEAFNSLNFRELIEEDLKTRAKKGRLVSIRFVSTSKRKHTCKIEYVIELDVKATGTCALVEKINPEFFNLKPEAQTTWIKEHYAKKPLPFIMGIDLGYTNIAALTYYTDTKEENRVISSKGFIERINHMDKQIDQLKSKLAKSIPERAPLIKRQLDKETLTKAETRQLRLWDQQINSDAKLCELYTQKSRISNDYLHKLSKSIISNAIKRNIQYIVVGKNKLWKQEIGLGSETNRKGYNLPHARLIEILRYKAMNAGIVLLETEESYTSKTSFVTNEVLEQYNPEADGKTNSQRQGTRSGNVFKIGQKKYHADINGSFNIIRKVFNKFAYDPLKVSLSYVLSELKMYGKHYFYDFNRTLVRGVGNTPLNSTI